MNLVPPILPFSQWVLQTLHHDLQTRGATLSLSTWPLPFWLHLPVVHLRSWTPGVSYTVPLLGIPTGALSAGERSLTRPEGPGRPVPAGPTAVPSLLRKAVLNTFHSPQVPPTGWNTALTFSKAQHHYFEKQDAISTTRLAITAEAQSIFQSHCAPTF